MPGAVYKPIRAADLIILYARLGDELFADRLGKGLITGLNRTGFVDILAVTPHALVLAMYVKFLQTEVG